MAEGRAKGLVDTSVVIDLDRLANANLPAEIAISAITLAELAAGPHATRDPEERAACQERLQRVEATFDPLPFDDEAARGMDGSTQRWSRPGVRPEAPERSICKSR